MFGAQRARKQKILYHWEHSSDTLSWISDSRTAAFRTAVEGLARGVYWFRVIFIDKSGEHEEARQSFAVN